MNTFAFIVATMLSFSALAEVAAPPKLICNDVLLGQQVQWSLVDLKELFQALHDEHIPLNAAGFRAHDKKVRQVTSRLLNKELPGTAVISSVKYSTGPWDTVVKSYGFDPYEGRTFFNDPLTNEQIFELIREFQKNGIALNQDSINTNASELSQSISRRLTGVPFTAGAIYRRARSQVSKNWPEVLSLAGVDPTNVVRTGHGLNTLSADDVIELIRIFDSRFDDLSKSAFINSSEAIRKILFEKTGIISSALEFQKYASDTFGDWVTALEAANVKNLETYQRNTKMRWSREKIIEVLQYLSPQFEDMLYWHLFRNAEKVQSLTLSRFKREIHPNALHHMTVNYFGSWWKALEAAKIPNIEATRRAAYMNWSKEKLVEVLKFLKPHFKSLDLIRLRLEDEKVRQLLFNKFDRDIEADNLFYAAKQYYGGWYQALTAARIDTRKIRTTTSLNLSRDLTLNLVHFLSQNRINLHWHRMKLNNARIRELLFNETGKPINANTLFQAGREHFGTWKATIEAASVPWAIGERADDGQGAIDISEVAVHIDDANGRNDIVFEVVDPAERADDNLIRQESDAQVNNAIENLSVGDKNIMLAVLDYLEDNDDIDNHEAVINHIKTRLNVEISWPKLERLLADMSLEFENE